METIYQIPVLYYFGEPQDITACFCSFLLHVDEVKKNHIQIHLPETFFFCHIHRYFYYFVHFFFLYSLILPQFPRAFLFPALVYSFGFSFSLKLCPRFPCCVMLPYVANYSKWKMQNAIFLPS